MSTMHLFVFPLLCLNLTEVGYGDDGTQLKAFSCVTSEDKPPVVANS